jgi:hypothetical protein
MTDTVEKVVGIPLNVSTQSGQPLFLRGMMKLSKRHLLGAPTAFAVAAGSPARSAVIPAEPLAWAR